MRKFVPYSIIYMSIFYLENLVQRKVAFCSNQFKKYLNKLKISLLQLAGPPIGLSCFARAVHYPVMGSAAVAPLATCDRCGRLELSAPRTPCAPSLSPPFPRREPFLRSAPLG
jgi:hypothetical protein